MAMPADAVTASEGQEACPEEVTLLHPHKLVQSRPNKGFFACCAVSKCSNCKDVIPKSALHYLCGHQPPCKFQLCTFCFTLGIDGGGVIQTASRTKEEGNDSTRSIQTTDSLEFPIMASGFPGPGAPPRIAAARHDFGLLPDEAAQNQWKHFIKNKDAGAMNDSGVELYESAVQASKYLRFLELTVSSMDFLMEEQAARDKFHCLELYSPLAGIPAAVKEALVGAAAKVQHAERSMGALVGMAVGDAAGAPFEFLDAVDKEGASGPYFNLKKFRGYKPRNKFKVAPGQWTDDSSMGFCLADTLLARGSYDGSDARVRFHNWWFRGYNNAFGNAARMGSVGLGGNVAKSLKAMAPGVKPTPNFESNTQDAGNGTIMRLAPVPIFYARDAVVAARMSATSSMSTHPGFIAAAAAAFLGFATAIAIQRDSSTTSAAEFLDAVVADFIARELPGAEGCNELLRLLKSSEPVGKEECWNWRADKLSVQSSLRSRGDYYNGYPCMANYFGSYCIDGLAVALWSFYHTTSFEGAVVRSINFLGDADTNAAICGQLAGAFYGYSAIDERWIRDLEKWDNSDTACRAALLCVRRVAPDVDMQAAAAPLPVA